ncbi:MAG TPA: pirin family protein [Nitrospiraceae bacterium]|jgi:redox-sensitive bicupin YhaK (pirin superfamily)|nr:pirin family protein [Nitrospiraceae bacterium]
MSNHGTAAAKPQIIIREPESIYQIRGEIVNGTFQGRWHFSFDDYYDPEHTQFGPLRVFNDDTLSPGAVWPLHPHYDIEVVTYCAEGEFRHADQHGKGGVLKKGWVQHTTVGKGMLHSEINNRSDVPMRFIQMWFIPSERDLTPSVEQKAVEKKERTNTLLPLVSNEHQGALPIHSDARVYSCFLQRGHSVEHSSKAGRGAYIHVLEGDSVEANGNRISLLGAAQVMGAMDIHMSTDGQAELLLVDVSL